MRKSILTHGPLACVLATAVVAQAAPTPEWQVTFGTTGKVPVSPYSKPRLQRDPASGGFYMNNAGQWILPTLAAKLDATGNPVWSAFERTIFYDLPQHLTVLADGSTVAQHGDVTRRAAEGSLTWSVPSEEFELPAVVDVAGGILMISPLTGTLSRLDPSLARARKD